ncbi:1243_t:CDS:2 [Paraglomus occultum]|uniref:1243_t:CDS:1 n=1 Tax=Paraglomus occultum TaxID=144539 RepID=A0A9N8VT35_9GLOM|nr:1243_t:CDS:2 [Paraglomus occultum]
MVSPTTSQPESHVALAPVANVDLPKPPAKTTTPDHPSCSSSSSSSSSTTAEINGHVSENKDAGEINKKEPEPENLTNEIMDKENDSDKKDDNRKTSENYRNENDTKEDTGTKSEISHNNILTDSNTSQKDNIPSTTSKSDSKLSSPPSPIPSPTFSTTSSFNSASDQSSTTPNPTSPKNFTSAPIPTVNVEVGLHDDYGCGLFGQTKRFTKKNSKKSKPAPILPPLEDQSSWPAPAEVLIKDKAKEASELAEKKNDTGKKEEGSSPKRGHITKLGRIGDILGHGKSVKKELIDGSRSLGNKEVKARANGFQFQQRLLIQLRFRLTITDTSIDAVAKIQSHFRTIDVIDIHNMTMLMAEMVERVDGTKRERKAEAGIERDEEEEEEKEEKAVDERMEEKMEEKGIMEKGTGTAMDMVQRQVIEEEPQYHHPRADSMPGDICIIRTEMGKFPAMPIVICIVVGELVEVCFFFLDYTVTSRSYGSRGPPRSASALYSPGYPQTYNVFPSAKMPVVIDVDLLKYYILQQVEYYFSVENLCKDIFLRTNMDLEGYVDVSLLAGFNRVKNLTTDEALVREALLYSHILEVNGDKVRKREGWDFWLLSKQVNGRQTTDINIDIDHQNCATLLNEIK